MHHFDLFNPKSTLFIFFFDELSTAQQEAQRRIRQHHFPGGVSMHPASVQIAHVRLFERKNARFFSRSEMLRMTASFGGSAAFDILLVSHQHEWYFWARRVQMRSSRIGIIFVGRVEAKQHDLWNYDKWGISSCACREQLVLDSQVAFTVDMKLTCTHTGSVALNVCGG